MASVQLESPLGILTLTADAHAVHTLSFGAYGTACPNPLALRAAAELTAYFAGDLQAFTVPLLPAGTPFQQDVWNAMRLVSYGETVSYAALAGMAGHPTAVRATGSACGKNPLPIFIPCHRILCADGSIGGFSAGLSVKRALLAIERKSKE